MSKRDSALVPKRYTKGDLWGDEHLPRVRICRQPKIVMADDGLPAERVNSQTKEKHRRLTGYVKISDGPRTRFVGPGNAGATYIDLFCGTGRAQIIGSNEWIDGSPVAAWKASLEGKARFSQVLIADIDDEKRSACAHRLKVFGAPVIEIPGSAVDAAREVLRLVNPYGLHLAFLDPYNLETLDFSIIEALSKLKHPDMLMHVSAMDLQRNVGANVSLPTWDAFAPCWRSHVDFSKPQAEIRRQLVLYWHGLVEGLRVWPAENMQLITGERGQRLYWLLLAAKHPLAHKFWKVASNPEGQKVLDLVGGSAKQ
jgi:three-Cys-motif partner protein